MDLLRKCSPPINNTTALRQHLTCDSDAILLSRNQGKAVVMILLDLSAAFNIVDYATILSRLEHDFSIKENALYWFIPYLNNKMQYTIIRDASSPWTKLTCGVPQGSVLGPFLCIHSASYCYCTKTGLKVCFLRGWHQLYMWHAISKPVQCRKI